MAEEPSEAELYVVVGRAGRERKVGPVVSPVDEGWFYAVGAMIYAVSKDRDPGGGTPRMY